MLIIINTFSSVRTDVQYQCSNNVGSFPHKLLFHSEDKASFAFMEYISLKRNPPTSP
jgi:hypothetical protein